MASPQCSQYKKELQTLLQCFGGLGASGTEQRLEGLSTYLTFLGIELIQYRWYDVYYHTH